MALIRCPECGKEVSQFAHACPNCGYPIAEKYEEKIPIRFDGHYQWADYSRGIKEADVLSYRFKADGTVSQYELFEGFSEHNWLFNYKVISDKEIHILNPAEGNKIYEKLEISSDKKTLTRIPEYWHGIPSPTKIYTFFPDNENNSR